jgi:magnesium transporter
MNTENKKLAAVTSLSHKNVTWTDIANPTKQEVAQLAETYAFHPLHLEESLLDGSLPQLEKEADYLFLLLHVPVLDEAEKKIVASQVAIFLGKDYLVTLHTNASSSVSNLFKACEGDEGKRDENFKSSSAYLLYSVLKVLLDDASGLIKTTLGELDAQEDKVFDTQDSDAAVIAALRQKILRLRRDIGSLKSVVMEIPENVHAFNLSHHFRDVTREAAWLFDMVHEAEKTVEIYKDADFTASTERTNEILAVLTILFTLAIPATVIGTFYGMNILLPGGIQVGSWDFLGTYTTLIIIVVASLTPALIMYRYFKKRHWF